MPPGDVAPAPVQSAASAMKLSILSGLAAIDPADWDALVGDESPFLEWAWLASLEESGCASRRTGWLPQHLALFDGDRLVGACPLYVKGHSQGEFVFDHGWAQAAARAGIHYYPKLLVATPFTPAAGRALPRGARRRTGDGRAAPRRRAPRALRERRVLVGARELLPARRGGGARGARLRAAAPATSSSGSIPAGGASTTISRRSAASGGTRCGASGASSTSRASRSQYHARRRTSPTRSSRRCTSSTARPSTSSRGASRYLNAALLRAAAPALGSRGSCSSWRAAGDEIVAGTFNVQKGDVIYGRYWGAFEDVRHLHFNVCYYAAIEHCIAHGITRFEPGAGGEFKHLRGFDARATESMHFLGDPRLARRRRATISPRSARGRARDRVARHADGAAPRRRRASPTLRSPRRRSSTRPAAPRPAPAGPCRPAAARSRKSSAPSRDVDLDAAAVAEPAEQDLVGEHALDLGLDEARHRPGAEASGRSRFSAS